MNHDDEKRTAAKLAKIMAMLRVRNTQLEALHAGQIPFTSTIDYSDVFVSAIILCFYDYFSGRPRLLP